MQATTPSNRSLGNLREWLVRSRLYFGDILSEAAATAVAAAIPEAQEADLEKLVAGLRTLHAILDPAR
jgi:hypothetical protein